jgi:hypothetical protein
MKNKFGWYIRDTKSEERIVSLPVFNSSIDALRGARRACRVTIRKSPQVIGTYEV